MQAFPLILLAIVLIISAMLKALDWTAFAVQVSYYGIVREPAVVKGIALGLIGLEAALGMALLLRLALRRATLPATFALLAGFTALLAWAWAFRDLRNCGCFGKFLPMTPPEAILKNVVMMAMVAFAWHGLRKKDLATSVGANVAASTTAACATTDGTLSTIGGGLSCSPESAALEPSAAQISVRPARSNGFALRNRHIWRLSVSMAAGSGGDGVRRAESLQRRQ